MIESAWFARVAFDEGREVGRRWRGTPDAEGAALDQFVCEADWDAFVRGYEAGIADRDEENEKGEL